MATTKTAAKTHYHVLCGLTGGYMPNSNEVYRTRRDAEAGARWLAESFRDGETKVRGSASAGYYECGKWEYIEINPCTETDCETDNYC